MVKRVKRFIVFVLFSFFYSLLNGKEASASSNKICIIPKNAAGNLVYNGADQTATAEEVARDGDCYN